MEDHQDTLGALTMMLDTLSTDFLAFWQDLWNLSISMLRVMETIADELWRVNDLKGEEMGKTKGKGKEKAQEEFRRARTEDNDGDMEMGRTAFVSGVDSFLFYFLLFFGFFCIVHLFVNTIYSFSEKKWREWKETKATEKVRKQQQGKR
ncbi:hypothetical protein ID866_12308 [Astraeus odoratus]|nr:hypothetical protein ID866_12308 [Astraeus odoratus]